MAYSIVGLGNPVKEYAHTRHNAGASVVAAFGEHYGFSSWKDDKKLNALTSEGVLKKSSGEGALEEAVVLVLPQTFMNKSGLSLKPLIKSAKGAEKLIVVYDDLDLPLGKMRISFGRNSGGHKGLASVIESLGTKDFIRVRLGIVPTTVRGALKKPTGEKALLDFILGVFPKREAAVLERVSARAVSALASLVMEGKEKAMQEFNSL